MWPKAMDWHSVFLYSNHAHRARLYPTERDEKMIANFALHAFKFDLPKKKTKKRNKTTSKRQQRFSATFCINTQTHTEGESEEEPNELYI